MGKLETVTCPGCGKPINRHDSKKITLILIDKTDIDKVKGVIHRQGTKITYHLKCYQETGVLICFAI